jgi:ATP-dependent Lhr-like helicase
MLLQITKKKERPVVKERPLSLLVPFLAHRQGLINPMTHNRETTAQITFNRYLCAWTAPAKIWETEILCARNLFYDPDKINKEIKEGSLIWYGAGKERIGFCRPEDLDLVFDSGSIHTSNLQSTDFSFFDRPRDFWEIKNELKMDSNSCTKAIWNEAWNGILTSDSFDPVRRGIEHGFIPKEIEIPQKNESIKQFGRQPRIPSALKNRWKSGAPVHGYWFSLLTEDQGTINPIEEDAVNRDRVRLLLNRYGILCRPLLEHEDSVFSWSKLISVIRRMELAGELVTGRFFAGINSLQFASPSIVAELEQAETYTGFYWMNAADPASPAGLDIEGLRFKLCARSVNNRLYFKGIDLAAISTKNGKELQIIYSIDNPDINELITMFKIPRTRKIMPENKILVEKINGMAAAQSEFAECFKLNGFESDRGKLIFW